MKNGDHVRAVRVWPEGAVHECVYDETWKTGGIFLGREIVAASWWDNPEKLFLHLETESWRLEPLKEGEDAEA